MEKLVAFSGRPFEIRLKDKEKNVIQKPLIQVVAKEGDDGMIHLVVPVKTQKGINWSTLYRVDEEVLRQGGDDTVEIKLAESLPTPE